MSHQPKVNLEIYNNINKCKQKMQVNKSGYKITKRRYATSGDGLNRANAFESQYRENAALKSNAFTLTDLKKEISMLFKIHWVPRISKMVLLGKSISG